MKKKVVIGMSGGVDSTVAAYLLKKQGYDVIGVFMQNWDPFLNNEKNYPNNENSVCDAEVEFLVAQQAAKKLDIPIHKVNFIKEYWSQVFEPFINDYKNGITPNPDVLCNKYIKFGAFHKYCIENFAVDYVATGHYAKKGFDNDKNVYLLKEAKDEHKDQTYFLCSLSQTQLAKALFPLQDLTKEEVREIAKSNDLANWNKKDSTGICFIGKRDFATFLESYIENIPGDIIDIKTSKVVGKHKGIHYYTIGQRKGLELSGFKSKYFICKKDTTTNTIYVTDIENENDFLYSCKAVVRDFNWISYVPENNNVEIRFRHTQKKIFGKFYLLKNNRIELLYEQKSKAVTPGQYAVIYQDGICLGGGQIEEIS